MQKKKSMRILIEKRYSYEISDRQRNSWNFEKKNIHTVCNQLEYVLNGKSLDLRSIFHRNSDVHIFYMKDGFKLAYKYKSKR